MKKTQTISIYGLLTALTVALSLTVILPVPATNGFVTLCEVGIYTTALLFGPIGGGIVGALSGASIDLISGYPQWMLFSLLIHGCQGLLTGWIAQKAGKYQRILALVIGSFVMILGYVLAGALLYGWPAGITSIFGNSIQNSFGALVTLPLTASLRRAIPSIRKQIESR